MADLHVDMALTCNVNMQVLCLLFQCCGCSAAVLPEEGSDAVEDFTVGVSGLVESWGVVCAFLQGLQDSGEWGV